MGAEHIMFSPPAEMEADMKTPRTESEAALAKNESVFLIVSKSINICSADIASGGN